MSFNTVLENIMKNFPKNRVSVTQAKEYIEQSLSNAEIEGPELVLKDKLLRKIKKADSYDSVMLALSESWTY